MRTTTCRAVAFAILLGVSPRVAFAQSGAPNTGISIRPFFLISGQRFVASQTFNAVFGSPVGTFWGGGGEALFPSGMFIDVTASRFSKSGQRVFSANGNVFPLGIPLTAKLTPLEVIAGWRFARRSRLIPYVGAGIGTYKYSEESPFSDPGEEPDTRHTGLLVLGGAEARVHRWVAVAADLQYTHIGGVLGDAGVSKIFGESDLGGLAARFRVIVGR